MNNIFKTYKNSYRFGILMMILSALVFSANTSFVRFAKDIDVYLITFMRFFVGLIFLIALRTANQIRFNISNVKLLTVRGILGAFAVLLMNVGITKIGLGKGTMLNYTYPVFAVIFAPFIVGEKNTLETWIIQIIAFFGCVLLVMPRQGFHFSWLDLIVLMGGMCAGVAVNTIRKLQKDHNTYTIFLSFCIFSCLITCIPAFIHYEPISGNQWLLLIWIGLLGTLGQLLMTFGYKMAPVNEGSLIAFLVPVLNFFISYFFFGESLTTSVLSGSFIVILCCIYTTFRKVNTAV